MTTTTPTVAPPTQEELDQARDVIEPRAAAVKHIDLAGRLRALRSVREELMGDTPPDNLTIEGARR